MYSFGWHTTIESNDFHLLLIILSSNGEQSLYHQAICIYIYLDNSYTFMCVYFHKYCESGHEDMLFVVASMENGPRTHFAYQENFDSAENYILKGITFPNNFQKLDRTKGFCSESTEDQTFFLFQTRVFSHSNGLIIFYAH